MKVFEVRNVNDALATAVPYLLTEGVTERSRNGDVIVAPVPVCTVYQNPTERVVFSPTRDANPFFHLMESLWMLAGRNDVKFVEQFAKRMATFSDDGIFLHGAYGYRWRSWFGMDQIATIIEELQQRPGSRRAVLEMWSATGDLCAITMTNQQGEMLPPFGGLLSKDVPCNTHAYFDLRYGKLNMIVCNRSNDVIWGAYGANAVHFSVLQEYMAIALGVQVGLYRQISNNFHAYTEHYDRTKLGKIADEAREGDLYQNDDISAYPIMRTPLEAWNNDLRTFMAAPDRATVYNDPFFNEVARPVYLAHAVRKEKQGNGLRELEMCKATDWKLACTNWIAKRERKP